jgi:uncharacterized protein YodC (DUF2158 family)
MYQFFRVGEEVHFKCLPDIKLIIEDINETSGSIRCKYYDDKLQKYIRLRLSADSLVPFAGEAKKSGY